MIFKIKRPRKHIAVAITKGAAMEGIFWGGLACLAPWQLMLNVKITANNLKSPHSL